MRKSKILKSIKTKLFKTPRNDDKYKSLQREYSDGVRLRNEKNKKVNGGIVK